MLRRILGGALALLLVAAFVVGWYYSGEILGPDKPPGRTGQTVLAHTDSTVTLAATAKARRPGTWAMVWPGGIGRIGPIVSMEPDRVVTRFERRAGPPPDTTCRLAGFAPDADPRIWLGVDFEDIPIPSRVGLLPSWLVPGADSTWAIFVHGRAATRAEVLRLLPAYRSLGLPCLVIAYRNDPDGPRVGDGSYRLGATEWHDLEDAVRWARDHGARDVVLVGCSMGGGIVAHFLRKSEIRDVARAVVLDAPALDWRAVILDQGRQRGVSEPITRWGELFSAVRGRLRWSDLRQIEHAREFTTPILIFHGDADATVPVGISVAFAAARPDLVTLHVVRGAGHVESMNFDAHGYVETLTRWLRERGIGAPREAQRSVQTGNE